MQSINVYRQVLLKSALWIVLVFLMLPAFFCAETLSPRSAWAGTFQLTPQEKAWLQEHPQIRLGIMDAWPPINFIGDTGKPEGIGIDYIQALNKRLKGLLVVVPQPFKVSYDLVKEKKLDGLMDITPKEDREPFFNFTRPYLNIPHVLVGRRDGPAFKTEKELAGKTVALERGFYNITYFQKNFPDVMIKEYDSTGKALGAVARGEADAYAGNRAVVTHIMGRELLANLSIRGRMEKPPAVLTIGTRKDYPLLRDILDRAIADIGPQEINAIHSRWMEAYVSPADNLQLTPTEAAWLKAHATIRVHNEMDWAPFNFNTQGLPKGYSIDYFTLVAQKAGLKIEYVNGPSWDEFIDMLQKGKLDVMLNIARTPKRDAFLLFSEPYITMIQALYTRQDFPLVESIEDLSGKRFAVPRGFYIQEVLGKYPQVKILEVDNTSGAVRAVSTGKADVMFDLMPVVDYIIDQLQITNLRVGGDLNIFESKPIPLHIAVAKDQEILASIIQKAMGQISDDELNALKAKWLGGVRIPEKRIQLTDREKQWIAAHPFIQVHNEKAWPPFNYYEHGIAQGFSIEYMNLLAAKIGLEVRYISGPEWNEFLDMIRDKKLDVMLNIVKTPQRQEYILFTSPYAKNPNVIVSADNAKINSMKDLDGKTVAVVPGFFHEEILINDYPNVKRLQAKDTLACLKAVSFGNADATIGELAPLKTLIAKNMLTGLQISGEVKTGNPEIENLRIGVRNDWAILVGILEKAMAAVMPDERDALEKNWLGSSIRDDEFRLSTAEEWWVKANPQIRLGIDPDWPPFEFFDSSGEHAGMSADYVRLLEKRLGVTFVLQKDLKTWSQVMDRTRAGKIDVLAAVGKTAQRDKFLDFTEPYLVQPLVVITRKEAPAITGLRALLGKTVAVQKDTVNWTYVSGILQGQELMPVDTLAEALQAVSKGKADGAVGLLSAIDYLQRKLGIDNLKVATVTPFKFGVSFAVRKDMPLLTGMLDRALKSIHEEEKSLIYDKWVNVQVSRHMDWAYIWKVALSVSGVVLIIFVFILRSNQKLASEAAKRRIQEKRFRALLEGAPDAMVIVDEGGIIQRVNSQAEKVFGYDRQALLGQAIEILVPEDVRERHPGLRQKYMQTPAIRAADKTFALKAQAKDGRVFPVDINLSPLETEEGTLVVASVRDVTERIKAESRLRLTQYAMDKAVHAILWLSPDDGRFLYANDAAIDQIGYTREEILDLRAMDVDITLTPSRWGAFVERLSENDFLTIESRQRRKDGEIRAVKVTNYLSEFEGNAIIVAFVEDVTEQKQAEKARRESEKRFRSYFESSQVGMAITSPEKGWVEANTQLLNMLGYTMEELRQTDWARLTHPDDLQADLDQFERLQAGEIDQYAMDKRFIRKDGEILYANLTVSCVRDEHGAIQNVLASYLDITKRKKAEEELQRNLDELERFNQLTINREERMIALKEEINALLKQVGNPEKYKIVS